MFGKIKNYIQDQINLAKLEAVERVGRVAAVAVFMVAMLIFSIFFFTFLCLAGAYYLSVYFESNTLGFLAMSGVFLFLLILFLLFKKGIQRIVINIVIAAAMGGNKKTKK